MVAFRAMRFTGRRFALLLLFTGAISCAGEPPPAATPPVVIALSPPAPPIGEAAPNAPVPPAPAMAASAPEPLASTTPAAPGVTPPPPGPLAKIPIDSIKSYRVDICYHGTFSLRQERDDYLASLGGHRPGPGHVPVFVDLSTITPTLSLERSARACIAAASAALHDADFGDVDTAMTAFAPLALQLAQDLTAARAYYQNGQQANDAFARGIELHTALTGAFKQLDALHDLLGAAITARRKSQPPRVSADDERFARAAIEDAREVLLRGLAPKLDGKAFNAAVGQLGKSVAAFKAWDAANPNGPWAKITLPALERFSQLAQASRPSGTQRLQAQTAHQIVNDFTGLVEAQQRAMMRAAIANAKSGPP